MKKLFFFFAMAAMMLGMAFRKRIYVVALNEALTT